MTPKGVARPLFFGSDFHSLLEYRNDPVKLEEIRKDITDKFYEIPSNQQSQLGEDYVDEIFEVFEDYQRVWGDTEKPLETEHEFKVQIAKYKGVPVKFHGIIDEIYADDSIGEHKTFNIAPDKSLMTMNMQSMLYVKALELETGRMAPKIKWDYIKSKPAERPMWLEKSKRFSHSASSRITPFSWERACKEKGVTDPEILAHGEKYRENLNNFFFRYEVDVIPEMVETVWTDFKFVVKDIITRGETNKVKNISRDCSWCNFRPICHAQFTGGDVDYVIENDFKTRE